MKNKQLEIVFDRVIDTIKVKEKNNKCALCWRERDSDDVMCLECQKNLERYGCD